MTALPHYSVNSVWAASASRTIGTLRLRQNRHSLHFVEREKEGKEGVRGSGRRPSFAVVYGVKCPFARLNLVTLSYIRIINITAVIDSFFF